MAPYRRRSNRISKQNNNFIGKYNQTKKRKISIKVDFLGIFGCNPGFLHLAYDILKHVCDHESLTNCRLVNKTWKYLLDNPRWAKNEKKNCRKNVCTAILTAAAGLKL